MVQPVVKRVEPHTYAQLYHSYQKSTIDHIKSKKKTIIIRSRYHYIVRYRSIILIYCSTI